MSEVVYLDAKQLGTKLGMHWKTIMANQDLPRVRVGGRVRFIESQVDQFIAMRSERKAAPKSMPSKKRKKPLYDVNADLRMAKES
jgi:predicted DNA-binding transcriptional regulator AlpA